MIRNIAVVSLSRGMIGEPDVQFEVEIGIRRLEEYGLHVKFMPHALKGLEYVKAHPEKRAEDLLQAFRDPEIDMILCAIGGDDTYRLLPYLFDHDELKDAVSDKVFLGFSDTTVNHLMLHKAGLGTFYGQAFLPDICEPGPEMLPYTRKYFEELIRTGHIREITPSPVWYAQRESFSRIMDLSCCRVRPYFRERFSEAVLIRSMIASMTGDMRICRRFVKGIICSRVPRTGPAASCFWKPAERSRHRKNTGARSHI